MQYSQNDEQYYVSSYFGMLTGTFLDIGANDGITLSNSRSLVQKGWKGVLVDASPKAIERLRENYKGSIGFQIIHSAIGREDGIMTLHESGELLGTGDVALVSSLFEEETKRWAPLDMKFEDVKVPCKTFKSLLGMSIYKTFDFITIDIEGMEIEVVPQINFEELGCRMAIIEWNGKVGEFYDKIMFDHGMKCIHVNAENRIYTL